jgi:prepilin-type N-terminal cleavage/methylation domain-containing protein
MARSRKGFTLIELVVVVLVIGILATIVIAKFLTAKESAYIAAMKSDLRNFAVYEQNYSIDNSGAYFSGDGTAQGFSPSTDVTVTATAAAGTPPTWHAVAAHARTSKSCSIGTNGNPTSLDITCP